MSELIFLRHGTRADHASSNNPPLYQDYKPYDPLLAISAVGEVLKVAREISHLCSFDRPKKNIYIHFSPFLRCCQTADLLVSALRQERSDSLLKFHLMCDFALSEWLHDRMSNRPPFTDSNEAYEMYTPNIRILENKRLISNFRPTTTLGPYNEPDLSYKDYIDRCKTYFKKLVATYDKPLHVKNNDLVIVVGHGYLTSQFMSYFLSHPIFEEIPECTINYACKIDGDWVLKRDCLGLLNDDMDFTLNLETDIVCYKTNFFKKNELDENKQYPALGFGGLRPSLHDPRPSFKIKEPRERSVNRNPLCPSAKGWTAQDSNKFRMKSDFKLKVMNDEAFKKAFDITHHPLHPVSPEVSPNSEPTRNNSVIDLRKLNSNEEIQRPFKLRYSLASDIPVHFLNSKVNSHVNLAQFQRNAYSHNNSSSDMGFLGSAASNGSLTPRDASDMDGNEDNANEFTPGSTQHMGEVINRLSRIRSLQRKRAQAPSVSKIREHLSDSSSDERERGDDSGESGENGEKSENGESASDNGKFSLSFNSSTKHGNELKREKSLSRNPNKLPTLPQQHQHNHQRRPRGNSIKFIPSGLPHEKNGTAEKGLNTTTGTSHGNSAHDRANANGKANGTSVAGRPQRPQAKKTPSMFYHLNSGSSSGDESDSQGEEEIDHGESPADKNRYTWFGQNVQGYA